MSAATAKATLSELDDSMERELSGGKVVKVQFNPETLKLQFTNQVQNNTSGGTDQSQGNAGRQFLGTGTTKLSVQLWFDASTPGPDGNRVDDVRRLTQEVVYFITARPTPKDKTKILPPGVRFQWGSIVFDGLVESLEESIEYFSPQGLPLRSCITLGLTQQKILTSEFKGNGRFAAGWNAPKTDPLKAVGEGQTIQSAAAGAGQGWQSVAAANGVENPRFPQAGSMLDMSSGSTGGARWP